MADANIYVTVEEIQDAITQKIKTQFPDLQTVEFYRLDRKNLPVPACILELVECEAAPDENPGTAQLAVRARFSAQLTIGFRQPGRKNPKLEIRRLAAAVAAFVHQQRWGVRIDPAEVIGFWPDDFSPELEQFEVWRVFHPLGWRVWIETAALWATSCTN